ncbi:hypothetical protein GQ457_09G004360 [Hibiscus cannabinus]
MSNSKAPQDVELLKSDIASFASSLGFAADSSLPHSGFNDVDFRKDGPLKPPKTPNSKDQAKKPNNTHTPKTDENKKKNPRPKPKPPVLSLEDGNQNHRFSREPEKFKNLSALPLVKASSLSVWYEDESELEKKVFGDEGMVKKAVAVTKVDELKKFVEKKREVGERLMWQYAKDYELSKGKSGDMKMVLASQRSGTAADKVSAFSFVVADNPVANLKSLDGLLGLVTSKVGKRYAFTGFEALKELFISKLLPDRKLKTLLQRPVNELPETKDGYSLLLFWYWEDCLKQRYVINNLNFTLFDTHKSMENKRKGSGESHVELDSRLLSALLMGVNRAFPYVSSNEADDIVDTETPILFQLVHSKNFNVGVQALMLLDKISSKNQVVSDRFYRALYSKLLLPAAMNSSKAKMFIGLLLRAMKSDVNLKRVSAFSKRILQVALQQPPQYACGCLFLISEVLKARPQLWNTMLQNERKYTDIHVGEAANSDSSEDEGVLPSYSDDDVSEDANELIIRETPKDFRVQEPKTISNQNASKPPKSTTKSFLPGGYDPRHREPSYSNADRASWWELMVLSTHVHPSVATMASTLLSGANIVYNGNPLNDLSLTAFLDKFMEKKPKASSWHGGSQIEPAKKLDMNNHLIGQEILSLAETDVPPEDLVFHKFYMNKMNSSNKSKKKKKKAAEEEAAEELFDVGGNEMDDDYVDGGDESDNEEIENLLDATNPSVDADGDYDYDDLDHVADEDDDELIGDASDAEMDIPSDYADGEDINAADAGSDQIDDDGDDLIALGDADDLRDNEGEFHQRKRKRKSGKKTSASPFASLEDYEHLLNEDSPTEKETIRTKKSKPGEKKKASK